MENKNIKIIWVALLFLIIGFLIGLVFFNNSKTGFAIKSFTQISENKNEPSTAPYIEESKLKYNWTCSGNVIQGPCSIVKCYEGQYCTSYINQYGQQSSCCVLSSWIE